MGRSPRLLFGLLAKAARPAERSAFADVSTRSEAAGDPNSHGGISANSALVEQAHCRGVRNPSSA
jgi:hypothetical protein